MKKKWLGVAIDTYDETDNGRDLVASKKAINYWKNLLENEFNFEHMTINNSFPLTDNNATKDNVIFALNKMVLDATDNDIHLFVFVGHGDFQEDKYSIVRDEILFNSNDYHDEKILLFGHDEVTDDEFRVVLSKNNNKGLFIFIFDCCYSGNIRPINVSQEEYDKIEQVKAAEIINKCIQTQSTKREKDNLQQDLVLAENTSPNIISKKNPFADKLESTGEEFQNISNAKQNIKKSINALIKTHPSFCSNKNSNIIVSKDFYASADISAIQKNIIDLHSNLFMRNNPLEISLNQNEILLCASSAYKKTYQPKIDGDYQSAFSYFLIKTIKEYLEKGILLSYNTLIESTTEKLKKENIYNNPQLIFSKIEFLTKQIFT
ncbi:hypothetical protein IMCC3317_40610 [Kordia antarctica]|uniref:Caspase domain protein n=1 Tax=Kordia antarctica TaxID=1218801 RepID=A0A7L4ZQB4_9FLAO|nr:caspase family protein [Kordia antarctica]QHI38667.1 hypothetical protein IMCC3317_40610 [Kordia antarctica]